MTAVRRLALPAAVACGTVLFCAAPALAAPSSQDATWMKAAHQYNLTEIAAGKAAQTRASSGTVRELGQMFVTDHTKADASLRAAATKLGVSLPTTPNATQRRQLAQGSATRGTAFDALFLSTQTAGHRQALAAGKTEVAAGRDATALALAKASAPVVQHHLTELLAASRASSPTSVNAGSGGQVAGAGAGSRTAGAGAALLGAVVLVGAGSVVVRRSRAAA